jgi:simple sugar transport system permease protein
MKAASDMLHRFAASSAGAVVLAMAAGLLLMSALAPSLPVALSAFAQGAVGTPYAIGASVNRAAVLALVGLGFILAFRANLTNIGGEGQMAMGGLIATAVALRTDAGTLPFGFGIVFPALAGALAGGLWAALAGWLKVKRGTNEVISTLLLSFVALWLVYWSVHSDALLRQPRTSSTSLPESEDIPSAAMIAMLSAPLHQGALVVLAAAVVVYVVMAHTVWGIRLQAIGLNAAAARRSGLSTGGLTIGVMLASGALGGLAGAFMIQGEQYNLKAGFTSGYGFDGLVVGLLARGSAPAVLLFALLFGFLRSGGIGMEIGAGVPSAVVLTMQGLVILAVAGAEFLRLRQERRPA